MATQEPGIPTIWMHAPSVGEALSAEPVLDRLKYLRPELRIIHTHLSSSVTRWEPNWIADRTDFLPMPFKRSMAGMIKTLRPGLILLPAADLWPGLIKSASQSSVPVAITGASIRPGSARGSVAGLMIHRQMLNRVSVLGAVTASDQKQWISLGANPETTFVSGDPRDQALIDRPVSSELGATIGAWAGDEPCVVMGSIEPSDLSEVRDVLQKLGNRALFILVSHDPTPDALSKLKVLSDTANIPSLTWKPGDPVSADTRVIIVSSRGDLRDLYQFATAAFVGGGNEPGKVHSIAEPVVFSVPVVAGPAAHDSVYRRFVGNGCRLADSPNSVVDILKQWLDDPRAASEEGSKGRSMLSAKAADDCAARLEPLLAGKD
jgi:3-deoxy-D-manno-octulosonic-acid transferase